MKTLKLGDIANYSDTRINCDTLTINNYVGADNILQNKCGKQNSQYVSTSGKITQYKIGDILIANIRPYLKKIWFADNDGGSSADVSTIRIVNNKFYSKFAYYNLFQDEFFIFAMSGAKGSKMPRLDKDRILDFPVTCLDLSDQYSIAKILTNLDDKITLNSRINSEFEKLMREIYDYWFVQFDFPNPDGKPYKSSGGIMVFDAVLKQKVPEGWGSVSLGQLSSIQSTTILPKNMPSDVEHYSIPAFDESMFPVFEVSDSIKSGKFVVRPEYILVSKLNPQFKCIWNPQCITKSAVCSTEFQPICANEPSVKPFLYTILLSDRFSVFLNNNASSSTGSRKRIDPEVLMTFSVPVPPNGSDIVDNFCEFASKMMQYQINLTLENNRLVSLRDWLLPMLMSGQVTVDSKLDGSEQ